MIGRFLLDPNLMPRELRVCLSTAGFGAVGLAGLFTGVDGDAVCVSWSGVIRAPKGAQGVPVGVLVVRSG